MSQIKLTYAFDGLPLWINPNHITLFRKNTESFLNVVNPALRPHGNSVLIVNGMTIQVMETPEEIVQMGISLTREELKRVFEARKEDDKEPWQKDHDKDTDDGYPYDF